MPAYDVVVYGTTLPAVFSAIRFARDNPAASVCAIGEWGRTGGMTTGGLTRADEVDEAVYWGITEEFFKGIGAEYGLVDTYDWSFEASVAQTVLDAMIAAETNLTIVLGEHLVSVQTAADPVRPTERRIVSLTTDQAVYTADNFVCGNYEADLAAHAGVPMQYGREASTRYGEPAAGVNYAESSEDSARPTEYQSGALTYTSGYRPLQAQGDADAKVMRYTWRLQVTDDTENMTDPKWPEPPGYDAEEMYRNFGPATRVITNILQLIPVGDVGSGKYQSNQNSIAGNRIYAWPTANHAERVALKASLYADFMGVLHYHATDPRVSQGTRDSFAAYGLCADEFVTDYYHAPGMAPELYVREGRRLIGRKVLTELDVAANAEIDDPICVGGYFMDRHIVQYYPQADGTGRVAEGHTGYDSRLYYPIGLDHIRPHRAACNNLVSVWGISTSSVAWASVRMEPTLGMVGEVAGMTLSAAHATDVPVGHVVYADIRPALDAAGAVYHFVPEA